MSETTPIIEKNGRGFILRISNIGTIVSLIVGMITILGAILVPYKMFSDFANDSVNDRRELRRSVSMADSVAKISEIYSIENNYNMRLYFELGQPDNFKWTPYVEIKKKLYLSPY